MKINYTFLSILFLTVVAQAQSQIENRDFNQPLDHQQAQRGTYLQRIQILIPQGAKSDSPVIFFLGGEGGRGNLETLAAPFTKIRPVIAIQADHRGYGSFSHDIDQTTPTYVNSFQAIEDFNQNIQQLKKEFTGPWALVGSSYSATLAVVLAAKYPESAAVVIASSAIVRFPKTSEEHDLKMRSDWPAGLYDKMIQKISSLQPVTEFDSNWLDRLFLQYVFVGTVQYKNYAPLAGLLLQTSGLPTADFVKQWRTLDLQQAKGLATTWTNAQGANTLSLEQAKTNQFNSRYWSYQQCDEFGSFFVSTSQSSVFPQAEKDYDNYCKTMFGRAPGHRAEWNILESIGQMNTPVIFIVGEKDPWLSIQLKPTDPRPPGKFISVPGGYHVPDRDDKAIENQAIELGFGYL